MSDDKQQITKVIDEFITDLNDGFWNDTLYNMIKKYIINNSAQFKENMPTHIAYKYFCFGTTMDFLRVCYSNPNDVYEVNNLSLDDFYDKHIETSILTNIAFGVHSIDDYPNLL